ncbi:hypothetical protein CS542_06495 [Pedobacter sp. IW39]|nr:hypothetical protein CS542_06495 [Pedobacter sp. IW39]
MTQDEMDQQVEQSATRMMSAAAFGQIIIPDCICTILALVGIDAKCLARWLDCFFAILECILLSDLYQ